MKWILCEVYFQGEWGLREDTSDKISPHFFFAWLVLRTRRVFADIVCLIVLTRISFPTKKGQVSFMFLQQPKNNKVT